MKVRRYLSSTCVSGFYTASGGMYTSHHFWLGILFLVLGAISLTWYDYNKG